MHTDFFGDNKDHGKGFILGSLFERMPEWNLCVDPLLSNGCWDPDKDQDHIRAYRRFLRLQDSCQLINPSIQYEGLTPVRRRDIKESYFQPHFNQDADIFFDPDNGIGKGGRKHLPIKVVHLLIPEGSKRIIIVFQSRSRSKSFEDDFVQKMSNIGMDCFLVFLGQDTYFVFLGRQKNERLPDFRKLIASALKPFDARRLRP